MNLNKIKFSLTYTKQLIVFLLLIGAAGFWACQKDDASILNSLTPPLELMKSSSEVRDLDNNTIVTPSSGLFLYDQISKDNRQFKFLTPISKKIGDPFWSYTLIYSDLTNNKEFVMMPFGFYGKPETQAIIQGVRDLDKPTMDYKLQLVLRSEVLNYNPTNGYINEDMALFFQYYDDEIYGIDNQNFCSSWENMYRLNAEIKSEYRSCTNIPIQICYEKPCPPNGGGSSDGGNGGSNSGGWHLGGTKQDNGSITIYFGGNSGGSNGGNSGVGVGSGGGVYHPGKNPTRKCIIWKKTSSGDSNNSNTNLSASVRNSVCVECGMYLVKVCTDDPNWWNKPWNITPCTNCDSNTSSDQNEKLENLCKKNKNGVIISNNKLPFTPAKLNAITEGNCNCIGNNNYEKCVLNDVFSECYSLGSQSDPAIAMLNLQMRNLMAENPALYAKAKCGDKSDSEVLKKLVSLNNTCGTQFSGVDFGILFDYYKANPGALSEGCDVALIANLKGKYPDMKNEIDGLLENGLTIEDIDKLFNAYNPANSENKNNGPLMSNTVGICPSSFVFKPKSNDPSRVTTGITNLSMSFSFGSVTQQVDFGNVFIHFPDDICINSNSSYSCYSERLATL